MRCQPEPWVLPLRVLGLPVPCLLCWCLRKYLYLHRTISQSIIHSFIHLFNQSINSSYISDPLRGTGTCRLQQGIAIAHSHSRTHHLRLPAHSGSSFSSNSPNLELGSQACQKCLTAIAKHISACSYSSDFLYPSLILRIVHFYVLRCPQL